MEEEKEIDLSEIFKSIIKRWKMIVCITLLCTIVSAVLSFFVITPKYEVSTKLFIGKQATDEKTQSYNTNDVTMYQKLLKTYVQMIKTNDLITKAINSKNLNLNSESVLNKLQIAPSEDTQVIEISYIDTDKYRAKNLVEAVTNQFISESQRLIPNAKVDIIESAKMPSRPVSPNKVKNIAIAIVLGLFLGSVLSILLDFTDNTFKTKDDLEKILGVPVIGTIPDENKVK